MIASSIATGNGHDWSGRFASLTGAFDAVECHSALIDGEIVAGAGIQGFSALQDAIRDGGPFTFHAFDLLECDGTDLTSRPLQDRRAALEKILAAVPPLGSVGLSPVIGGNAAPSLEAICGAGGEGLIAKRRDAPYRAGRGRDWLKIKCRRREDFVVLGWLPSERRGRPFASLLLGTHDRGTLVYAGKVGTGFDTGDMATLSVALSKIERSTSSAEVPASEARGARWVTPRLVVEVSFAERTAQGRVRHAVFRGLRQDKPARSVMWETPTTPDTGQVLIAGIAITNPDRVVFPQVGITKQDVAAYYEAIADRMLPTCANRPVSLLRLPEGMAGDAFFQRHAGKGFPEALKVIEIEERDGGKAPYMYLTDAKGLVAAAQMGTIEFHVWAVRRDRLDRPERLVFDLDPDDGLGWAEVVTAAFDLRDRLGDLGLPSWPLVTGGKGIHVIVNLKRTANWETAKLFSRLVATLMAREEPQRFTSEMSKAKRKGRIFIDWLRNERGATAIAPYSIRARDAAPVAMPVTWDELAALKSAQAFGLEAAIERRQGVTVPNPNAALTVTLVRRLEESFGMSVVE